MVVHPSQSTMSIFDDSCWRLKPECMTKGIRFPFWACLSHYMDTFRLFTSHATLVSSNLPKVTAEKDQNKDSCHKKHLFYCCFIYTVKITLSISHHLSLLWNHNQYVMHYFVQYQCMQYMAYVIMLENVMEKWSGDSIIVLMDKTGLSKIKCFE